MFLYMCIKKCIVYFNVNPAEEILVLYNRSYHGKNTKVASKQIDTTTTEQRIA